MSRSNVGVQELSAVCQSILDAELQSGVKEGKDYGINLQRGKRPNHPEIDAAPDALIASISPNLLQSRSYQLFHALLNNYTSQTGVAEKVTPEKEREISDFLDEVIRSRPMSVTHNFLASKGLIASDRAEFKSQLYQMWFRLYTREVRDDTCGFEHVFVGETKDGEITGLHNWLQFNNLERQGTLDYRGYIFPRRGKDGEVSPVTPNDLIISVQFNINRNVKDVSSIWLGTSPEFEMAIYTLCFVAGADKNVIRLRNETGEYEVEIRAYHIRSKYGDKVGSAFPVLLSKAASPATQQGFVQPPMQYQPAGFAHTGYPNQQAGYPDQHPGGYPQQQAQQQQQNNANQGCGNFFIELIKAIFKK